MSYIRIALLVLTYLEGYMAGAGVRRHGKESKVGRKDKQNDGGRGIRARNRRGGRHKPDDRLRGAKRGASPLRPIADK